ncbi:fibronectin type III domain-containing protein [Aureispira sp. CCB-E]|uniref:fibronectin type III domain-containing protein n=1 Tax=Aureispira sp. CCB-E TaxID=3051121 RepID=UPI00286876C6|nr:T9SS type A sorting domain-containing protein [Aureispira sp. CCB-E]WMX17409.1 T9SS type A sorting domain-containing protein [Aureispira sp. CCB-E]
MQYFILFTTLFISFNVWAINPPNNIAPSNGAMGQPTRITLDWTSVGGNTGYLYELDTTPAFNSPLHTIGNASGSSVTLVDLYFGTTYYWRAATKGPIDTSAYSTTWSFTTSNTLPYVSPSNGAQNQSTTTTIDWAYISGATGYIYEVDTSPIFNSPLREIGTTPANSSGRVLANLYFGTTYYWRAAVMNANDTSNFGSTWSFTTRDGVNNVSPSNGAQGLGTTTTIDWSAMSGNNGYIYEVDTSPSFTSPLYVSGNSGINSSEHTLSNLYFGTTYYWRAAVINTNDTSNFGSTWSFTTGDGVNNVSPSNGAQGLGTTTTIDWSAMSGNNGYIYEVDTSPSFTSPLYVSGNSGINSSEHTLSNLYFGTTYYWRAAVINTNDTSNFGSTWSFTTGDGVNNVSPSNGAQGLGTTTTIDWSAMSGNSGYIYEVDTSPSFTSPLYVSGNSGINSSEHTLSNLYFGTTYYWRAAVINTNDTSNFGSTWSFTTGDGVNNVSPSNGAQGLGTTTTIDWSAMSGNNGYIYEVDTSPSFTSPLYVSGNSGINSSEHTLSNLYFGTTYYWRAAIINANDTSNFGSTWSFTTQYQLVAAPLLSSPLDGASNIPVASIQLVWDSISNTSNYQIKYSTSSNFTTGVQDVTATQLNTTLSNLSGNTTYYWKVRGRNNAGQSPWSTVWSFTTEPVTTEVSKFELQGAMIYPNPVGKNLYLKVEKDATYQVKVFNLEGRIMFHDELNGTQAMYDVTSLVRGVYFIEIVHKDNVKTLRFIKD